MTELINNIRQEIFSAIDRDDLTLPTLPEIALRVRDIAQDADASISDLTKVIGQDPALSARIVRVTNSPLLRAATEIRDLNMAVSRLGMNYTANLAIGLAMEQLFQATSSVIDRRMREAWQKTSKVAAAANAIARDYDQVTPDEATLAGLMHNIGALPVLTFAEERPDLISDGISLNRAIDTLQGELGQRILQHWEFPDILCQVPVGYANLERGPGNPIADVVQVACLIVDQLVQGPWLQVDWSKISAFERVNLAADDTVKITEISELAENGDQLLG